MCFEAEITCENQSILFLLPQTLLNTAVINYIIFGQNTVLFLLTPTHPHFKYSHRNCKFKVYYIKKIFSKNCTKLYKMFPFLCHQSNRQTAAIHHYYFGFQLEYYFGFPCTSGNQVEVDARKSKDFWYGNFIKR